MSVEFLLPDIGEGLAEAEIVRWLVDEGEPVEEDQALVEVETDKAVVEIPAPLRGTLMQQGGPAGTVLPIGALLAVFAVDGEEEQPAADQTATPPSPEPTPQPTAAATAAPQVEGASPERRVLATPATRALARKLDVDIRRVTGSGPGGRIVDADIEAAAAGPSRSADAEGLRTPTPRSEPVPPAEPGAEITAGGRSEPMRGLRRTTARRMTTAWREVPHVNSVHEVDLFALRRLREELAADGHPIPLTAFLVKATALALTEWPSLNASVDEEREEITFHDQVNLAVAVDTDDGLLIPVIPAADTAPVARIGATLRDVVSRAQARQLTPGELRGATFTVNNYGPLGGWFGTSLVTPGQVGILSLGPARDRVVPVDGEIAIRPVAVLTLAADHRVADGRELIGFCVSVREHLEAPLSLLVEA